MADNEHASFIASLLLALRKERATYRIYTALAARETNELRRKVLLKLAETEAGHAERWSRRLTELGVPLPPEVDPLRDRVWRWLLVQQGTNEALARIEQAEEDDIAMYADLATSAPTEADRDALQAVQKDEAVHGRLAHDVSTPSPATVQARLDTILGRERWHHRGGGWIGQAIYGANDGLGSVFGISHRCGGRHGWRPGGADCRPGRDARLGAIDGVRRLPGHQGRPRSARSGNWPRAPRAGA